MSSSAADADRFYASLRAALEPAGPERVGSETSAELWMHAALLGTAPPEPAGEHNAETLAERVARGRLERYMQDVAPFLGDHGDVLLGDVHVRPMRSGLYAAFTLPLTSGGLIVVDDATHDLRHSAATLMMAAWGPPPEQARGGEARSLPLYDCVRLLRLELGALRWGGKLWQPIDVRLPEADRGTAATLSRWALQFILAHEVGHLALGHVASGGSSVPRRTASEELAADAFAARALRRMVRAGHPDADEVHAELDALVRVAIRLALGVVHAVSTTYLVTGDDHPPTADRMASLATGEMRVLAPQPLERPAEILFQGVESAALSSDVSLEALVAAQPNLSFAAPYPPEAFARMQELDELELITWAPLPTLLSVLGDAVAGAVGEAPPPAVLAAARRADDMNVAEGDTEPVPADAWVRFAVGRWWLFGDLLARRSSDEVASTLRPPPATRFTDWATWLDAICPPDLLAAALAALLVYVQYGPAADGRAMRDSGLLDEVARWLGDRAPIFGP